MYWRVSKGVLLLEDFSCAVRIANAGDECTLSPVVILCTNTTTTSFGIRILDVRMINFLFS